MKWTTQTPTVAGYYWVEAQISEFSDQPRVRIVNVYASSPSGSPVDTVFADGDNYLLGRSGFRFLRWSDQPIPEPTS